MTKDRRGFLEIIICLRGQNQGWLVLEHLLLLLLLLLQSITAGIGVVLAAAAATFSDLIRPGLN